MWWWYSWSSYTKYKVCWIIFSCSTWVLAVMSNLWIWAKNLQGIIFKNYFWNANACFIIRVSHLMLLLIQLYKKQHTLIKDYFKVTKAVRQRCVISPYLFKILADMVIWEVLDGFSELQLQREGFQPWDAHWFQHQWRHCFW